MAGLDAQTSLPAAFAPALAQSHTKPRPNLPGQTNSHPALPTQQRRADGGRVGARLVVNELEVNRDPLHTACIELD